MNEADQILFLITSPAGYGIDLFTMLRIYRSENLFGTSDTVEYVVDYEEEDFVFTDPKDAVAKFLELRNAHQVGYDFEKPPKPSQGETPR
jgi:hypothetical protein